MESISIEAPTILGDAESMDAVISEVRKGLMSKRKSLAPWLFYDDAGSALFEEITAATRSALKQSIGGSLCSIESRRRRSID